MANFTNLEQILSNTLDEWALKSQGIVMQQKNPLLFMQLLRINGLEIVKLGDIQKVRHEQKVISREILEGYRTMAAAKRRLELLEDQIDIIKEDDNKEQA